MPLGVLFWVLYVVSLLAGLWGYYDAGQVGWYRRAGGYITLWVLIGMLGWHSFGPVVR